MLPMLILIQNKFYLSIVNTLTILNRVKFGALILTSLELLDFGLSRNAPPRFQYWYEDIAFDLRACID